MKEFKPSRWLPYVCSFLYLIILLLVIVPPFNMIFIHFIMVPILVLFMVLDRKKFVIFYGASLLLLILLAQGVGLVLAILSLFFLPPVIAMSTAYKKNESARLAVIYGCLTLLGELVLLLLIIKLAGYDPVLQFKDTIRASWDLYPGLYPAELKGQLNLDEVFSFMLIRLPYFLVAFSVYYVFITHIVGRFFMRKLGIAVPGFPPLRQLRLPRSFIFYFLIALILEFTLDLSKDTMLVMIVLNIIPLLTFCFALQALSFLSYLAKVKKWNRTLPILAGVLMIFPPIWYLFSLLGLLDLSLPLRERLSTKS